MRADALRERACAGYWARAPASPYGLEASITVVTCVHACVAARALATPVLQFGGRRGRGVPILRGAWPCVRCVVSSPVSSRAWCCVSALRPVPSACALTAADRRVAVSGGRGAGVLRCDLSLCFLVHRTPCERLTAGARTDTHPLIRSSIVSRMRVTRLTRTRPPGAPHSAVVERKCQSHAQARSRRHRVACDARD